GAILYNAASGATGDSIAQLPQASSSPWSLGSFQATKLAIIQVNGGSSPTSGVPFSVVVQAQDPDGNAGTVQASTGVSLSVGAGTGILGGTTTGTITAGQTQTTISGVTYTNANG